MVEAGVAEREKFSTIYSGMDVDAFENADRSREQWRDRFGCSSDHFVIGKIARLAPLKGHDDLISAAQDLIGEMPHLRFLLIGDGGLRARLEARIHKLGLRAHFRFAGLVPPGDMAGVIGTLDLLVHTSLREGLARCLPQALLAAKPVVSYDVDGAAEVIVHEDTGLLIRPRDVASLRAAIRRLVNDPQFRGRLGRQGRRHCATRFDHRFMTNRVRELYQRILHDPRPRTSGDGNSPR
ncbi:MAG: glycosyltransferase family 4 protein [bacterium]|nr:glycosyltransferase family 4 protein [bacterium]